MRKFIQELCEEMDYNPLKEMILLAKDKTTPLEVRAVMHKELAGYFAPKLKAVDPSARDPGEMTVQLVKFSGNDGQSVEVISTIRGAGAVDSMEAAQEVQTAAAMRDVTPAPVDGDSEEEQE